MLHKLINAVYTKGYLTCIKSLKARSTVIIVGPRTRLGRYTT